MGAIEKYKQWWETKKVAKGILKSISGLAFFGGLAISLSIMYHIIVTRDIGFDAIAPVFIAFSVQFIVSHYELIYNDNKRLFFWMGGSALVSAITIIIWLLRVYV